ncbi:TetR/AcrR family transcriptional regulator [Paenibacillus tuaregi]|uniref:TetR/AcrR family transcriptional regulator n=1 Tax=Paenibacillus tuaregi TaxID=1816681 RepID=UPI0009EF4E73|nr:TetR/AcrR family transcriptional regulator [Paenibacillus tuaregi]
MPNQTAAIDRRIKKSKKALKESLLSLMQTKEFKEISITDIVHLADLNRGTFYKHYQYKEDLLQEIIDDVITDLIASYREPYQGIEVFDVTKLTSSGIKVFEHVELHASFYTLIVRSNACAGFQNRICSVLRDLTLQDLGGYPVNPAINQELQASYHAYAILGMIIEWVNGGFKHSAGYMADQLLAIIKTSLVSPSLRPNFSELGTGKDDSGKPNL